MSFEDRRTQHDDVALGLVRQAWMKHRFAGFTIGTETDSEELRAMLRRQHDETSLRLRYRPDQVFIRAGFTSVICEVKSERGKWNNFSIEADSLLAARWWANNSVRVAFNFVDLGSGEIKACWCGDIGDPDEIRYPRRNDRDESASRLKAFFPRSRHTFIESSNGSGTPFLLIPKDYLFLYPIDSFIESLFTTATDRCVNYCESTTVWG